MALLNLSAAPEDPIARLMWLSGVMEQARVELNEQLQLAYYEARVEQRLDVALALGMHSMKRVLAWTRAENNKRGRSLRWGDGYPQG